MASKTEICNLALSHLGIGTEISDIVTEQSPEAKVCRRFYDVILGMTLRDRNWTFATVFTDLALIEEDPNTEWGFSYRQPSGCVKVRRILSGIRNDTRDSRIPYKIGNDGTGILIFCDMEDAILEYTELVTNPELFPPDFVLAHSYNLAAHIAPRITAGDPFKNRPLMLSLYASTLEMASKNSFNEERNDLPPESEFIRARGGVSND